MERSEPIRITRGGKMTVFYRLLNPGPSQISANTIRSNQEREREENERHRPGALTKLMNGEPSKKRTRGTSSQAETPAASSSWARYDMSGSGASRLSSASTSSIFSTPSSIASSSARGSTSSMAPPQRTTKPPRLPDQAEGFLRSSFGDGGSSSATFDQSFCIVERCLIFGAPYHDTAAMSTVSSPVFNDDFNVMINGATVEESSLTAVNSGVLHLSVFQLLDRHE